MNQVFKFEKRDITSVISYKLKLKERISKSINYVSEKLKMLGHYQYYDNIADCKTLSEDLFREEKNDKWITLEFENIKLVIRHFRQHFTIFYNSVTIYPLDNGGEYKEPATGCFEFLINLKKCTRDEHDEVLETSYEIFIEHLPTMIQMLKDNKIHAIWNDLSFKRPKFCDAKTYFKNYEIDDVDHYIFCAEEISRMHLFLFAENEMYEKLKDLKVGDIFYSEVKINRISTKNDNHYYHSAGIEVEDRGRTEFHDVYSLTRWYLQYIFPDAVEPDYI